MFCCNFKPIVALSPEGHRLTKNLKNLTYALVALAFLKLFLGDLNGFFNDMFLVLMSIMTYLQANYFTAAIFIFMLIFQLFFSTTSLLLVIQDTWLGIFTFTGYIQFYFFIVLLSFTIYVLLTYYAFMAYREYKALFKEQMQPGGYD